MKHNIRFISSNKFKLEEAKKILDSDLVQITSISLKIEELQTEDTMKLVSTKAISAYKQVMRPLFVEHTGLYLSYMNGLPGGLTQIFWDNLGADKFSELFGNTQQTTAYARTTIAFIDGKKIHIFEGEISGRIAVEPRGCRDFQWDCIFIPDGYTETFSEMGDRKNEISMRRKALDVFSDFLRKGSY